MPRQLTSRLSAYSKAAVPATILFVLRSTSVSLTLCSSGKCCCKLLGRTGLQDSGFQVQRARNWHVTQKRTNEDRVVQIISYVTIVTSSLLFISQHDSAHNTDPETSLEHGPHFLAREAAHAVSSFAGSKETTAKFAASPSFNWCWAIWQQPPRTPKRIATRPSSQARNKRRALPAVVRNIGL